MGRAAAGGVAELSGYVARAAVRVGPDGGLTTLRSDGPLQLRPTREGVFLAAGAAGPLGGDHLSLDVHVAAGAGLVLRTTGASVALPGDGRSVFSVRAVVEEGASLSWVPEPTVAAEGCDHEMIAVISLDAHSVLIWREETVLGRSGEPGGRVRLRTSVDRSGQPLLRSDLALGGPANPVVAGAHRAVGTLVLVGAGLSSDVVTDDGLLVAPMAAQAVHVTALAHDALELRRRLDHGLARAGTPG